MRAVGGEPGDREAGRLQNAGKPLPLVETVVFNIIREGTTGWNLLLQGYLDGWGVTQENYRQVMSRQGQLSEEMKRR
jgi:peptide/nickel transport system substrate-binding protein